MYLKLLSEHYPPSFFVTGIIIIIMYNPNSLANLQVKSIQTFDLEVRFQISGAG